MKKQAFIFLLLSLSFTLFASGAKVVPLPEILNAEQVAVDDNQVYFTEGTTIYIYSLKDFKLIKKFGKKGEGPREFMLATGMQININVQSEDLIVNSFGKISYFTKEGVYKKELKVTSLSFNFVPLGDRYLAAGLAVKDGIRYLVINIFDAGLKKLKEIYRTKDFIQQSGDINPVKQSFAYYAYDNKIFVAGSEGFVIDVLDTTGKPLYSISRKDYQRVKLTGQNKKDMENSFKTNPQSKELYHLLKDRIVYPEYFPAILNFYTSDGLVYVVSWEKKDGKFKFFIFGIDGKLKKEKYLPVQLMDTFIPFPFEIYNKKMYQVVVNEETDESELHIIDVE